MIKVECVSCKSPYDVDERRIPEKGMKMRCPKCNTSFMVARDGTTSAMPGAAAGAAPRAPIAPPLAAAAAPAPRAPMANAATEPLDDSLVLANREPGSGPPKPGAGRAPAPRLSGAELDLPNSAAPVPQAKPASLKGAWGSPGPKSPTPAPKLNSPVPPPAATPVPPPSPPPSFARPVGGGSPFNKTLMGAATAQPSDPNAKSPIGNMLGLSASKPAPDAQAENTNSNADLPAVKPAPKPAVPWGSLAPPSMDAKAPAARPQTSGGLPKGAIGAPAAPGGGAQANLKASSAGSAFGAAAKQTLLGPARAKAPEPLVAPEPVIAPPPATPQPSAADAFADLPAPKSQQRAELPLVDLPAAKPSAAGSSFGMAKPAAPAQRPPLAPDVPLIDLPAAKLAPKVAPLGQAPQALVQPANTVEAPDLELELDLAEPPPPTAAAARSAATVVDLPAPGLGGDDADPFLDLPAPKPPGGPLVDLPAPKLGAPAAKFAPPPAAVKPSPEQPVVDLPAPRGIDLPAPKPGGAAPKFAKPAARAADPGFVDLPAPKGGGPLVDLPAPKGGGPLVDLPAPKAGGGLQPSAAAKGFVDLPAPKGGGPLVDLPAPKGAVDLPAPLGIADLPTPKGIADLPTPKGVTDLPGPKGDGGGFGELDLPMPKSGGDEASFGDLELPDLPVRAGFGNIELPMPRAGGDVLPPKAATYQGVGPLGDESNFGDIDLGGALGEEESFADLRPDDLVQLKNAPATSMPPALQEDGGAQLDEADYGEAGLLDDDAEEDMEFGIAGAEGEENLGLPPELLRRNMGEAAQAEDAARGKRALHVFIGVAVALVVLGGGGAALGLTDYGFFGIYFWEQYLPEAADARFAREAIDRAEKTASTDTYRDVQRGLALLGESRHKAGLNRELLTRSLLHESLFSVRFGNNSQSSAHAAAILARLEERHGRAPGMELARAADAARRGAFADAEHFLSNARAEAPQDAYVGLLAGEVALHQGKLAEAEKAFASALKQGGGARAQWGLARVALARTDENAQRTAVEETLKLSPLHAEARIASARLLWNSGKQERALTELRQALGQEPIGDQFVWSSKLAKAGGFALFGFIDESRGHLAVARKAYDDALAADPYMVEALLGAGRVLLRERRWNDALARFESALGLAQKGTAGVVLSGRRADVEARLGQSRAQLALNRAPEAKNTLVALMKDNPNDPEIVRAAGQAEEAVGNKQGAEELLAKAVELSPTSFPSYLALAQFYFKQNRADKASETLNEAASKVAENVEMRRLLGQSELARNRFDSAVHEFKRAVELDPEDLDAQFGLGVAYRKTGQLDAARELFDKIGKKDPQYAGLALERGQLLEAQGEFEKAVDAYRVAHDKDPSDVGLNLRLGAALVEAGRLDEAELTLQTVMKEMPNSAEAEYFTGRLALARGRGPDALTHFDRALSLDTSQAVYHLYAARAALDMANLGRTLEEAEAALNRDGSLGDAYWVRGIVRMRSGAVRDALKDAKRALELNPSRFDAYALMAECFDELRQLPQAVDAYHTALDKDPKRGEWWYKLGRLNLDMGARGEANQSLEKAMALGDKMDPRPWWLPDAYRLAGELARTSGNRKLAVTLFKRYLDIAPDGALDRDDVRKLLRSWDVELNER